MGGPEGAFLHHPTTTGRSPVSQGFSIGLHGYTTMEDEHKGMLGTVERRDSGSGIQGKRTERVRKYGENAGYRTSAASIGLNTAATEF